MDEIISEQESLIRQLRRFKSFLKSEETKRLFENVVFLYIKIYQIQKMSEAKNRIEAVKQKIIATKNKIKDIKDETLEN